jgi:tRNA pseudouridine55 synthase
MDGLLLIDKPSGLTSHNIIKIVRKQLNIKKVGHAGTLDPLATGLLVVMLGKTTKLSNLLTSQFKTYQTEMELFIETDSGDITGKIIKREKTKSFKREKVQEVINSFCNYTYWQNPPLYSAIKVEGKKLYEYARRGKKIEVPPRQVAIKKIELLEYIPEKNAINLQVECSKGTYIRSLVKDIAQRLATIATVTKLRRISSGSFHINQATNLEGISPEKIISYKELNHKLK